jgi:O-antigen/teichoic acid export membrane protein
VWGTFFSLVGAQVFAIICGVGASVLWTRFVPKEVYGQYQLVFSLMKIISSFCINGLGESLFISAAKGYDGNLARVLKYKFGATVVGSFALLMISFYYQGHQPVVAAGLWIAAFLFPFYELQKIGPVWLRGKGCLKQVAVLDSIGAVLSMSVLAVLVLFGCHQLDILMWGLFGVSALFSLVVLGYVMQGSQNRDTDWDTIRYGFHTTAATLLGGILFVDRVLIGEYFSLEQVAVYSIALLFPAQIKTLYSIFNQMLTPKLSEAKNVKEAWEYLKPKLKILTGIFLGLGLGGFFLIPVVIPWLFSERYAEAVPYAKWLWLGLAVTAPMTYLGNVLRAQKKMKFVYVFEILNPLVLLCLYFAFIGYGLWGITFARIIYYLSATLFFAGFFYRYLTREVRKQ